jgi:hypothetical protein
VSDVTLDSFETFGALLRHLRKRGRLTLRVLGTAVCYSEAQITRLETGQRLPDRRARTAELPRLYLSLD